MFVFLLIFGVNLVSFKFVIVIVIYIGKYIGSIIMQKYCPVYIWFMPKILRQHLTWSRILFLHCLPYHPTSVCSSTNSTSGGNSPVSSKASTCSIWLRFSFCLNHQIFSIVSHLSHQIVQNVVFPSASLTIHNHAACKPLFQNIKHN